MVVFPSDQSVSVSVSAPLKSKNTTFPPLPKRGQVKAQIFESLAKSFISVATRGTGGTLRRSGGDGADSGSSPPATPPPSPRLDSDTNSGFFN